MQTFFSFACVVALICAIVFGIKAFKKKQKQMIIPFVVALAACFGAAMIASPPDDTADTQEPSEVVINEEPSPSPSVVLSEVPEPSVEPSPSPTPESSEEPEETPVPTPVPSPSPTLAPTPEPTPEPSQVTAIRGHSSDTVVYVSTSHKIHSVPDCSGMKKYTEMTLGEADSRGYEYCSNCW